MPVQTHISITSISLTSKALSESAFESLKMDSDKKNKLDKEMVADILMLVLPTVTPVLLALVI